MEVALDRLILSDEQWERIAPHLPGKVGDPGRRFAHVDLNSSPARRVGRIQKPSENIRRATGCRIVRRPDQQSKEINDLNRLQALLAETEGFEPSIELYNPITV